MTTKNREGWFKSSFSAANNSCVEVRLRPGGTVAVRDTKDRPGPTLVFTADEWVAFLAGARAGEFDFE